MENEPKKLTQEEVDRMLRALTEHFGCRVAPVNAYCAALETWASVVRKGDKILYGHDLPRAIVTVRFALSKSNLAARLVYGGEKLRTRECPAHKGTQHLSLTEVCPHGCQGTGWLPEVNDGR